MAKKSTIPAQASATSWRPHGSRYYLGCCNLLLAGSGPVPVFYTTSIHQSLRRHPFFFFFVSCASSKPPAQNLSRNHASSSISLPPIIPPLFLFPPPIPLSSLFKSSIRFLFKRLRQPSLSLPLLRDDILDCARVRPSSHILFTSLNPHWLTLEISPFPLTNDLHDITTRNDTI
ncbi:hypothetical protein GGR58DRAFT_171920 [Xylaria digitata]|nr:hypothetical protein GGR58DRAFT_171920 [Xylaria digitata]